ncbi:SWIM zinc finger domain-containing protein [Paenibacillus doosanensis]|uniref:SWIM zinc finger family protein n=1 Tax=Paenibacillus doosanensis TaxID=1229154 RepID=UPI0021807E9B|nr:SWIM zinc finger family protein [Paenibacillus doosanensis]MCS7464846.1 SWIM zinc finger domain-containing protein [Paenibacillus doosanensis]
MLKLQIPKNRMNYLIERMQHDFELAVLEQGWEYYHKGRVSNIELLHGVEIHSLVGGSRSYEVVLDMDRFEKSECGCSHEGCCKHMAATLFTLYASFARPELLLQHLKQTIMVKNRQQQSRTGASKPEKKAERLEAPKPSQPPSVWQRFFDQQFYGYSLSQQHSIELFYSTSQESLLPLAASWDQTLRGLYDLHVLLFAMRKIEQFYSETKTSYMSYYIETGCKTTAKQCMEQLAKQLPGVDMGQLAKRHAGALDETLTMLGDIALSGKESPLDWLMAYRSIWSLLADYPERIDKEKKRLRLLLSKTSLLPRRRDALLVALAHFDVMDGHDDKARAMLEELSKREARDSFLYLHRCYERQQWDRMLAWLRWMLPVMQRAQQEELRTFCTYWMEAVSRQPDDGEWVDVMIALLPRTYYFYTSYLLKAGRFKSWVDLQIANRVSPIDLYTLDLKTVEEHNPSLLLPLYHQAVERCIAEKNRNAYKMAIKLLKKLHAYYKKLDRENTWEEYIYRLATRYARLRALQEELRKGKWIP